MRPVSGDGADMSSKREKALREVDTNFWIIRKDVDDISGALATNVIKAIRLTRDTDDPEMILWKHREIENALMKFRADIIKLRYAVRDENPDVRWDN